MLDDTRIRKTLKSSGLLSEDAIREVEVVAFRRGESVYRTAIATGRVQETEAVSHLAGALGVPSVSLEKFTAKPKLIEVLPIAVVRKYRVLPVGLKPRDGENTLFVAMDDPQDLDALEAVSQHCTHPVVPLLAGPIDLDRALDRVYPTTTGPATVGTPAPEGSSVSDRGPDIIAHVLEDLDGAATSDMLSALSMLDDIPRNRHDCVTSPGGFQPVRKRARPETDLATTVETEKSTSTIGGTTHLAAPGTNDSSKFQRSGPAGATSLEELLASGEGLAAAVAKVLVVKGIVSVAELKDALED